MLKPLFKQEEIKQEKKEEVKQEIKEEKKEQEISIEEILANFDYRITAIEAALFRLKSI